MNCSTVVEPFVRVGFVKTVFGTYLTRTMSESSVFTPCFFGSYSAIIGRIGVLCNRQGYHEEIKKFVYLSDCKPLSHRSFPVTLRTECQSAPINTFIPLSTSSVANEGNHCVRASVSKRISSASSISNTRAVQLPLVSRVQARVECL